MNVYRRRGVFSLALAGLAAGCSGQSGTTIGGMPTLDNVKNWMQILSQELPGFVQDMTLSGVLKGSQLDQVNVLVNKFETLATQVMQLPPGVDPSTTLNSIVSVLATMMSFFPQSAPFVPLVFGLQLLISGFLAKQPVNQVTPPATTTITTMHAQTREMRR